ncbi:MAG: helix-turn-helix domain-containing protein [Gemmatimonadales bacterium]|nr:helix-turn-helix domain-containing protein [Gemmatimonadales bacterium]
MRSERLLKTNEVLRCLRINRRTLYRLLKSGSIPATRVGHEWRFRQGDLDAWLESQRTGSERCAPRPDGQST